MSNIPRDPSYRTACPAPIKAKITVLENAAMAFAYRGAAEPEDREAILQSVQVARYNLEQSIITTFVNSMVKKLEWKVQGHHQSANSLGVVYEITKDASGCFKLSRNGGLVGLGAEKEMVDRANALNRERVAEAIML